MKKFIKIKTMILAALSMATLSSCLVDQSVEQDIQTTSYPTATFTLVGGATTFNEEGGKVFTYQITTDKMIERPIDFSAVQVGGTATVHEDYDIEQGVVAPYTTSGQIVITIYEDEAIEETETLNLEFITGPSLANKFLSNPNTQLPDPLSLTIENYVSDDLVMTFDWETGIEFGGVVYGACDNIDLDVFVSDADGFDINDPWATFNGTNYSATGDCPEAFDWILADWGDGEYIIWHENWSNGFAGLGTNTLVPITATFLKPGGWEQVVVQDDSQALNSDYGGEADDVPFMTHGFIAKLTVANGLYTITDYAGTVLVDGKSAKAKTERPDITRVREREPSATLK